MKRSPSPTAHQTAGGTTIRRAAPAGRASATWQSTSCRGRSMHRCWARGPAQLQLHDGAHHAADRRHCAGWAHSHQRGDRPDGRERQYRCARGHGLGLAHVVEHRAVHRGTAGDRKRVTTRSSSFSPTAPIPIPRQTTIRPANKSTYAAYGYLQPGYNNTGIGRLLTGTSVGQFNYTSEQLYRCTRRSHGDAVRSRKGRRTSWS